MNARSQLTMKEEVEEMIEWLSSFGRTENEGVTRLLYQPSWVLAQRALKEKMKDMGLSAYFDDVGNLYGRLKGTEEQNQVILTGSHIDTVVSGGKYDGAFGVIAGLIATKRLQHLYGPPKQTIEVAALCEEEGSRFPLAFWGSGSVTGKYHFKDIRLLADSAGTSFIDAMHGAGFGQGKYPPPRRQDIACFVEMHIEQGLTLERKKKKAGIVNHIVGQRRYTIDITGESNHAGTTPMELRKDALGAAAKMIAYVTQAAKNGQSGLVATAGHIEAKPNVANVIAGEARFTLDIRHHEQAVLEIFCSEILDYFNRVAERERIQVKANKWMDVPPVKMDEKLTALALEAAQETGVSFESMVSGAGHDSQVFGVYCPTSLIFVPSHGGISHSPKEFTRAEDLEAGVRVLMALLHKLAYE